MTNCSYEVKDRSILKYHYETCHPESIHIFGDFKCGHEKCENIFKTKKQKIIHHNVLERECQNDRNKLITLLKVFKINLRKLIINNSINTNNQKSLNDICTSDNNKPNNNTENNNNNNNFINKEYMKLREFYSKITPQLFDLNHFQYVMGYSFDDIPNI